MKGVYALLRICGKLVTIFLDPKPSHAMIAICDGGYSIG